MELLQPFRIIAHGTCGVQRAERYNLGFRAESGLLRTQTIVCLSPYATCFILAPVNGPSLPLQQLSGVIERITFYNEENGYTVARFVPEGKSYTVTVIGNL